jgi:hypothetical protein
MIKPGERLWNGATVTAQLADAYNAMTRRVEGFERAGIPVPEYLLNGRHNLIRDHGPIMTADEESA